MVKNCFLILLSMVAEAVEEGKVANASGQGLVLVMKLLTGQILTQCGCLDADSKIAVFIE